MNGTSCLQRMLVLFCFFRKRSVKNTAKAAKLKVFGLDYTRYLKGELPWKYNCRN